MGMIINPYRFSSVFQTLANPTLDADALSLSTDNIRVLIDTAAYAVGGTASQIRLTFTPASAEGCTLNPVYVGHQAGAGNPYDFDGNQKQVTFSSGGASCALSAGGASVVSDSITFAFDATKKLIVAFYVTSNVNDSIRYKATLANYTAYHDNGAVGSSTAGGSTPASQSAWASHGPVGIDLIEVL